jgi:heme exporter protein C
MVLKWFLCLWMAAVCMAAFLYAPPAAGFVGPSSRIIFFHVPAAWVSVLAFLVSMIQSVRYLRGRRMQDDALAAASARLGLLFTVIATVSGSIFARMMWGAYWNWDPRETTIVLLLLIYCAYLVFRGAVPDPVRRARLSAVYAIFAFLTVPFLVFVLPRLTFSLHPSDTVIPLRGHVQVSGRILQVFLASLAGFTGLFFWMLRLESRILILSQEATTNE